MKISAILLLCFISTLQSIDAQVINDWRPEHRTGVSSETGLLKSWPDTGPVMLWFNQDLPSGFSSVTFGKSTLYLTGTSDKSNILIALDTLGKIKWQTPYGSTWNQSYPESRCAPTIDGNRVYVTSGTGELVSIDANSGAIIWSLKASDIYKGTFGPWGIAESVLVDGDKVYFSPGGPETMTIAVNKNTGKLIWKSESLNDRPAYVSPILITYAGRRLIINVSASYVFGIDPSAGKIIWKIKHLDINSAKAIAEWDDAPAIKCVTPLYSDGKIYITGGYNHGGIMLNLIDGGSNIKVAWTDDVLDVHHGGVVLVDGFIYGSNWTSNSDGNWCCIEWSTGRKKYEEKWKCKGSIISAEGLLYLYDERSGFVGLAKAAPEKFNLVSSFKIAKGTGPHWAHPSIHNKKLYIRHGNALMAFDIKGK